MPNQLPSLDDLNAQQAEEQAKQQEQTIKNAAAFRQKLAQQGHAPDPHLERLNRTPKVSMPLAPEDQHGQQQFGIPEDWDHKTAKLGPFNEKLPTGAVGWKPDGTPWYGTNSSLTEWAKGFGNNLLADITNQDYASAVQYGLEALNAPLHGDFAGFKDKGQSAWESYKAAMKQKAADKAAGEDVSLSLFKLGSRLAGQVIQGVGNVAGEVAVKAEQAIGGTEISLNELANQSDLPDYQGIIDENKAREAINQYVPDKRVIVNLQDAANFLVEVANKLDWVDLAWTGVKALDTRVGKGIKVKDLEANYAAGRIAYSNWINPALKEEYIRRFQQGENAYLLQMEMQNPIAELAGQLIFDPLNVVGFLGKGDDAVKATKTMQQMLTTPSNEIASVVKTWDKFSDISKADDLVKATQKFIQRIGTKLDAAAVDNGLNALTYTGKRAHVNDIVGNFTGWLASTMRNADGTLNVDDTMEVLRAVFMMSSKKTDEVAEAVQILGKMNEKGVPLGVLFSDGAGQTSKVLRSMTEGAGGIDKLLDGIKSAEKVEDILDILNPATEKAVAKLFPSLKEQAKAGRVLTMGEQAMLHVEDLANSKALRGLNSFFAHVYMGMSPGYVVRNAITNALHVFIDEGVNAIRYGIIDQIFGAKSADKFITDFYGYMIKSAGQGLGSGGIQAADNLVGKVTGWGLRWGQKAEIGASKQIVAATTRRVLRKMLKPGRAIPDIAPLIDEGMDVVTATHLQNLLIKSNGNVKLAEKIFRSEILDGGGHDLFKALGWIDPNDVAKLDDLQLMDAMKEIVDNAGSIDDVTRNITSLFDDLLETAKQQVAREVVGLPAGAESMETLEALRQAGRLSDEAFHTAQLKSVANYTADTKYKEAVAKIQMWANKNGVNITDIAKSDNRFRMVLDGSYWDAITHKNNQFTSSVWRWNNKIKSDKFDDLNRVWREIGLNGEPPANLTQQQLLDELWDNYFTPRSRAYWQNVREEHAGIVEDLFKTVTNGKEDDFRFMEQAREALIDARKYDTAVLKDGVHYEEAQLIQDLVGANEVNGNQHLNNILKKYFKGEYGNKPVDAPAQLDYETVFDALYARAKNKNTKFTDVLAGEEHLPDLKKLAKTIDPATPLAEMDAQVSDAVSMWAQDKLNYLSSITPSEGGFKIFDASGPGTEVTGFKSSYPDWYRELNGPGQYFKGKRGKQAVEDALQSLIDGADEGTALQNKLKEVALGDFDNLPGDYIADSRLRKIEPLIPPDTGEVYPSLARGLHSTRDELVAIKDKLLAAAQDNWGRRTAPNAAAENALKEWFAEAGRRTNTMRYVAEQVATEARNFALLDYSKRKNFDTILGLIYPYNFWYSRTYPNWITRLAKNPQVLAGYAKYRRALEQVHAGLPDWWKYNINTNELLGLDSKNPMFFNLEATLNPLNGMTGVDFDDPYKKTGWWTTLLADMNRFGPSTHTALSWITGLGLYMQGEKEASSRWVGRTGSFTAALTAGKSLLGMGGTDVDPLVRIFSGKTDAYTARRANRALYAMAEEGTITSEQALDAARTHDGDIWQMAIDRAVKERAPGQLSSYFLGVGFKPRTMADMEVDQAYNEYFAIMNNRGNLSPVEFRQTISQFFQKYPDMDTVLVGMKDDDTRDAAYAWAVLGRIPPGDSYTYYEAVGLDANVVERWYDSKGSFDDWTESDRNRFMAAVLDISAVLAIPNNVTQQDWDSAKTAYSQMNDSMKSFFGVDILDEIDTYYEIKNNIGDQQATQYLRENPMIGMAMDFKSGAIVNGPQELQAYYSGVNKIEQYYKGQMYNEAEQKFGAKIFDLQNQYWSLPPSERKPFLKENPVLKDYWDFKDTKQFQINQQVAQIGSMLPEGLPASIRQDFSPQQGSVGAQDLFQQVQNQGDVYLNQSPQQWQMALGDEGFTLAMQALYQGGLSYTEQKELDYYAALFDMDTDRLLQYLGASTMRTPNTQVGSLTVNP